MANALTELQISELRQLRLTTENDPSLLSISMKDLLNEETMEAFLTNLALRIEASNEKVAASIFAKRYAFLAVTYLYAMTSWNQKLDISFENLTIETDDREELWLPGFHFNTLGTETLGVDREQWRTNCIESLFKNHLFPVLDCLSQVTKISKLILWENIAVYIFWLYETVLQKEGTDSSIVDRSKKDFQYIMFQAPGSLFGDYHENPLKRYYNNPIFIEEPGKEVRPRKTCCFSHLTKSRRRCASCPQVCKNKS